MKFSSMDNKVLAKPSKVAKELPLIAQIPFKDLERAPASVEASATDPQPDQASLRG
ncbi:MAG: hypothetical protein Q6365_025560 [Candidatus Sigynarchaeota archaeon]